MDPQKALEAFGFLALVSELDEEEEPEYDEQGRVVYLPDGWLVEYIVTTVGYQPPSRALQEYSETVYGDMGLDDEELGEMAGIPELYIGGRGEESDISVAETAIREEDIPKKARFV